MEALTRARVVRVVLTGSESTGKSTLAVELARHYGAELVPEFVRAFAEQKGAAITDRSRADRWRSKTRPLCARRASSCRTRIC
jgi:nicotinamide riboside kinase